MTIELSGEDLELVIHAMKQYRPQGDRDDPQRIHIDDVIARLEVAQREGRRVPADARGTT